MASRVTLQATVRAIAGNKIESDSLGSESVEVDVDIWVGAKDGDWEDASKSVSIWGTGWRAYIGPNDATVPEVENTANPLGPMLAACFGASYCFRTITRWNGKEANIDAPQGYSLWDGSCSSSWDALTIGEWKEALILPSFYLCGAGAVGQALVAALSMWPGRSGHAVVLDHDPLDDTNLNRYILSYLGQGILDKTELTASFLRSDTFSAVEAVPMKWEDYVKPGMHRSKHPELIASEVSSRFELILSCVDKNPARHSIQAYWPRLILGGSTHRLGAQVMRYDLSTNGECLMCNNPLIPEITIEQKANELRALNGANLDAMLRDLTPQAREAVHAYLAEPKCGTIGEQYVNELGQRLHREFAVGFVSAGTGLLLAAALIQQALRVPTLIGGGNNAAFLGFELNSGRRESFQRALDCKCSSLGLRVFQYLWGVGINQTEIPLD